MGKWDDDTPFAPLGSMQPTTVTALLQQLRLTDAPPTKKAAAIKDWLHDHVPSPLMEHSLRRSGYSDLLRGRTSA